MKIKIITQKLFLILFLSFSYTQENIETEIKILNSEIIGGKDLSKANFYIIDHLDSIKTDTELYARMINRVA